MRVNKKVVIDIKTNQVIERDSYKYIGPISHFCGGGPGGGGAGDFGDPSTGNIAGQGGSSGLSGGMTAGEMGLGMEGLGLGQMGAEAVGLGSDVGLGMAAPGVGAPDPGGIPGEVPGVVPTTETTSSKLPLSLLPVLTALHPVLGIVYGSALVGQELGFQGGDDTVGDQAGGPDIPVKKAPAPAPKAAPAPSVAQPKPDPVIITPSQPRSQPVDAAENERRKARRRIGRLAMRKSVTGTKPPIYIPTLM